MTSQPFEKMLDGTPVEIYTLSDGVDYAPLLSAN